MQVASKHTLEMPELKTSHQEQAKNRTTTNSDLGRLEMARQMALRWRTSQKLVLWDNLCYLNTSQ